MTSQRADRSARRRGRRVAIAASMLAAAASASGAGAATGSARPAAPRAGRAHRVLNIVQTSSRTHYSMDTLQYVTRHDRYQLVRLHSGQQDEGFYWQRDVLGPKQRLVKRVDVDPADKTVFVQTRTVPPLAPAHLGIRSTIEVVQQAIQDGKASPQGLTHKDGQRVRLLVLEPNGPKVRSNLLWVDPSTDRPVAASEAITVGGGGVLTKVSRWEHLDRGSLDKVTRQPKVPAGYSVSRQRYR